MKIVIDADGCPVVKLTIKVAKEFNLECIVVADTSHFFEFNEENVKVITVSKGDDSADFRIVNLISNEDIVITQDYGLAAMCLSKQSTVMNQNGLIYSKNNIDSLLSQRHVAKKIRRGGGRLKGPSKRTQEQDISFENTLRNIIKNKENTRNS